MNAGKSIGALFAGLLFAGCAASQTVQLQSTPPLKGKGTLKVTKLDERNTRVELHAEQLELPGASYVVWAVPFGDLPAVKVGRLGADQHLKATIGLTDFWIIMTAEHSAEVQEPGAALIMSAEIRRVPDWGMGADELPETEEGRG